MTDDLELKKIVGEIAAAYFGNSHVTPGEIATVISQIASSIAAVGATTPEAPAEAPEQSKLTPAQIRRSITREAIISFEDNKPYKTMRRHLASRGLTPDEYRSKWGLPRDYPMVAPSYSEARSNLAKERGLGGRLRGLTAAPASDAAARPKEPAAEAEPATPARAAAAQAATPPSVQRSRGAGKKAGGPAGPRAKAAARRSARKSSRAPAATE